MWIDPPARTLFVDAMLQRGWSLKPGTRRALIATPHAIQLQHPEFGLEVDVHDRYPGFLVDPQVVFDMLWARRRAWTVSSADAWAVDQDATCLIELLHLAREPAHRKQRLRALLASELVTRESFLELAWLSGASSAIAPHVGGPVGPTDPNELEAWNRRVAVGRTQLVPALIELQETALLKRPKVVWRLIWLPGQEVLAQYPDLRTAVLGTTRARFRRWGRGARQLRMARRVLEKLQTAEVEQRP